MLTCYPQAGCQCCCSGAKCIPEQNAEKRLEDHPDFNEMELCDNFDRKTTKQRTVNIGVKKLEELCNIGANKIDG